MAEEAKTKTRTIHDPEEFQKIKDDNTAPFFKQTRVHTCSHVMMKNGQAVAVSFPLEKTGWKAKNSYVKQARSTERASVNKDSYKMRMNLHAGMNFKPLEPYTPNAHRSRLPTPTVVMPYKNSSQIVIGDRASDYRRQFTTTNSVRFPKYKLDDPTTNGGILSTRTKWNHYMQQQ